MKNIQPGNSHEALSDRNAESRSPYLLYLIWIVWLPLIIPTFVRLFQAPPIMSHLIAILIGALLFFSIYLWASWRSALSLITAPSPSPYAQVIIWLTIVALIALSFAFLLSGTSDGWQSLFFFTCGYVGGSLPASRAIWVVAILTPLVILTDWLVALPWYDLVQVLVFIPAIVLITRSIIWSINTSWELHAARKEIARLAVTTERLRIARDLHDLLGHNLSLIALKSELAGRLVNMAPERAIAEIADVEHVARTTLQEVREAVTSYRQPTLLSELQAAREILAAAGITYRYEGDESNINTFPTTIETVLAWTVREGVTNVIRHSRAQQCTIRITQEKHTACIEIIDNGAITALMQVALPTSSNTNSNGGNGLRGLTERVTTLGGRCESGPRSAGGFRLAVYLPMLQRVSAPSVQPLEERSK